MKSIGKFIKSYDGFGHSININFDQHGASHQTKLGGCVSLLIKIVIILYVFSRFEILIHHTNDDNFTEIDVVNIDKDEEYKDVDYTTTNITLLHNVYH